MRIKYESPQLEIFQFSLDTQVLAKSNTQEPGLGTVPPGGGIVGGEDDENPFG